MNTSTNPSPVLNLPRLGLGTWRMGEDPRKRPAEVAAVRLALELGLRMIDTAEMYGEGGAESVVGQALSEALRAGDVARESLCIVTKVYPHNASRRGVPQACERSLARLGLDQVDLYLLHWRGEHPLTDTVAAFEALAERGRIRHWGVSNFDVDDMAELAGIEGGERCAANQVYYSLGERGPEHSLMPWMQAHHMPLMAYSPIDQGALAQAQALRVVGERHGCSAAQVALAWVMARPGVVAIPKAVNPQHLRDNVASQQVQLDEADLARLDRSHPAPTNKRPLAMI